MKTSRWIGRWMTLAAATVLTGWVAQAAPQNANFSASAVKGTVSVEGTSGKKPLNVGDKLNTGDTVTTAASSTADLAVSVGGKQVCVLHIWESSSYTILDTTVDEGADGIVLVAKGKVGSGSVSGESYSSPGSKLTIEAGGSQNDIKGSFLIRADGSIYSYSGQVSVTAGGRTVRVSSGQYFNPAAAAVLPHTLPKPVFVAGTTSTETTSQTQVVSPTQPSSGGGN